MLIVTDINGRDLLGATSMDDEVKTDNDLTHEFNKIITSDEDIDDKPIDGKMVIPF